jgi:hypothetical protein
MNDDEKREVQSMGGWCRRRGGCESRVCVIRKIRGVKEYINKNIIV